ncbi:MAG: DUF2914 domain-containing protein [Sandaracinus sp.]
MSQKKMLSVLVATLVAAFGTTALAQDASVTASEVVAAHGFEHGRAVGPATSFTHADGRIYIAITVENTTGAESEITVQFQRADQPVGTGTGTTHLTVPAQRHYHTVARTGARPGQWRAVVRDAGGNVIGQVEFSVSE